MKPNSGQQCASDFNDTVVVKLARGALHEPRLQNVQPSHQKNYSAVLNQTVTELVEETRNIPTVLLKVHTLWFRLDDRVCGLRDSRKSKAARATTSSSPLALQVFASFFCRTSFVDGLRALHGQQAQTRLKLNKIGSLAKA